MTPHLTNEAILYRSRDGLFWALYGNDRAQTRAAIQAGAQLVLFYEATPAGTVIGLVRAAHQTFHVGHFLRDIQADPHTPADVREELDRWYRSQATFAGRGTSRSGPSPAPLRCAPEALIATLARAWQAQRTLLTRFS